jgi:hypothetical protein
MRRHWPQTHVLLRGDGHFSNPELMQLIVADGNADFIFGQAENLIKQVKCDLKSDRTSAGSFLANFARLLLTAGAYVLHRQLRHLGLQGTPLATAQSKTVMLTLFKIAARVKQYAECPAT